MREHGYDSDDFPALYEAQVMPAHILIIAGPIWLGDQSSLTRKLIERLYAYSSAVNEVGQWAYYGKVGAAVTTGNEDGVTLSPTLARMYSNALREPNTQAAHTSELDGARETSGKAS